MTNKPVDIGADFSDCGLYRYRLWQIWDPQKDAVGLISLNPSVAEVHDTNPTFRRCLRFAKDWGFGALYLLNLFAYRAATPQDLKRATSPIGPENDRYLRDLSRYTRIQVAAWGNDGSHQQRAQAVRSLLPRLHALKLNTSGEPAHPLYLRADLKPFLLDDFTLK